MPCSFIYARQTIVNKHSQQNNQQNPVRSNANPDRWMRLSQTHMLYSWRNSRNERRFGVLIVPQRNPRLPTSRAWPRTLRQKGMTASPHKLQVPKCSRSTWLPRLRQHCNNPPNLAYWRGNCKKGTKGYSRWGCSSPQIKFTIFNILFRT